MRSSESFIDSYWHVPFALTGVFCGAALVFEGSLVLGFVGVIGGTIGCVDAVKTMTDRNQRGQDKSRDFNLDP